MKTKTKTLKKRHKMMLDFRKNCLEKVPTTNQTNIGGKFSIRLNSTTFLYKYFKSDVR
jgi:hypothetical protein